MSVTPLNQAKYDLTVKVESGNVLIECEGDYDFETIPNLRQKLKECVPDKFNKIVVYLSRVEYLDSTGVGLFASLLKKAHENGKKLVFVGARGQPRAVLDIIGFDDLVEYYETQSDALLSL